MNKAADKFEMVLAPVAEKIEVQEQVEITSGLRPLAELLVRWYKRRLAELEANSLEVDSPKSESEEAL